MLDIVLACSYLGQLWTALKTLLLACGVIKLHYKEIAFCELNLMPHVLCLKPHYSGL